MLFCNTQENTQIRLLQENAELQLQSLGWAGPRHWASWEQGEARHLRLALKPCGCVGPGSETGSGRWGHWVNSSVTRVSKALRGRKRSSLPSKADPWETAPLASNGRLVQLPPEPTGNPQTRWKVQRKSRTLNDHLLGRTPRPRALTICFSVYLLELSRFTASMCPKSMSWPSRKMKSSLHTYFFLL